MKTDQIETPKATTPTAVTPPATAALPEKTKTQEAALAKVHERVFGNLIGKTAGPIEEAPPEKLETPPAAEKKTDPKPDESEKPKEGEAAGESPAAAKKVEDPKPTRPSKRPKPAPTVEDITKAAATAATKAVVEATAKKAAETPASEKREPEVAKLDPVFKADEQVYRHLSATNPKYATLVEDLNQYAKESRAYMLEWKKENPGKRFDLSDEEHAEFVESHQPTVTPTDMAKASAELGVKEAVEKEMEPIRKQREKEAERAKLEQVANEGVPLARGAARDLNAALVKQFVPEALKEDGTIDIPTIKTALEDPALAQVVAGTLQKWEPLVRVAAFLLRPGAEDLYAPNHDPLHAELEKVIVDLEKMIDGREHNGMTGLTREAFAKLSKDERANHYTVNGDVAVAWMNHLAGMEAKKALDEAVENSVKIAQRRGYKPGDATAGEPKNGQETKAVRSNGTTEEPPKKAAERQSVTATGGGPTVTAGGSGGGGKLTASEIAYRNMIGKGS